VGIKYYNVPMGGYLRHKNSEDPQLERESMAWLYFERNGNGRARYFNNYLYCPKKEYHKKKLALRSM
jgi:hypothetical protein